METVIHRMDKQWSLTAYHRELNSISCDRPQEKRILKRIHTHTHIYIGFPGGAGGKESVCQCRRHKRLGFNSWFEKIPWRRIWQPTPVFLPGESHDQKSLSGFGPWDCKESDWSNLAYLPYIYIYVCMYVYKSLYCIPETNTTL